MRRIVIVLNKKIHQNGSLNVAEGWGGAIIHGHDSIDLPLCLRFVSLWLNSNTLGLFKPIFLPVTIGRKSASGKSEVVPKAPKWLV